MKTNREDIFSMLNDVFNTSTHKQPEVRPYNTRPFESYKNPKCRPAEKNSLTLEFRVIDNEFEVTIPNDMTVEGMVACLLATCKYLCKELELNEEEVTSRMTELFMKMLVDCG